LEPSAQPRLLGLGGFVRAALGVLRPEWPLASAAALAVVPTVAFTTLYPLILRSLIDDGIATRDGQRVVLLIGAMVGLLLASAAGEFVNRYLTARLVARAMTSLRGRMFARLQELSATFYARAQSGDLLARFTADLEAVERALTFEWSVAVQQALTLAVAVAVLLAVEWRLALLCL